MQNGITGIDHPIIAVRDMEAARPAYERLGFTVTPRGSHPAWGTGNWCIMFADDYLELRGIFDPDRDSHGLDRFLERREGLMGVALATNDAGNCHDLLVESGLHPGPLRQLKRDFELAEGTVQPEFSLFFLDEAEAPGLMSVVLLQHLTPELIRRPDWLRHPNGALGVSSMTAAVEDLDSAADAHARLFGAEALRRDGRRLIIEAGNGVSLIIVRPSDLENQLAGVPPQADFKPPGLVSLAVTVADVEATARHLAEGQIDFARIAEATIRIAPKEACGALLEFHARP